MSGRSAYVRRENRKIRKSALPTLDEQVEPVQTNSINSDPSARSVASGNSSGRARDDLAGVSRRPTLVDDEYGFERSAFRVKMDQYSKNSRDFLSGKKIGRKDEPSKRPQTSNPVRAVTLRQQRQFFPGLPENTLKCWTGGGNFPKPWKYPQRDPELWDETADTIVFIGCNNSTTGQQAPELCRVNSYMILATGSDFLQQLLSIGELPDDTFENQDRRLSVATSFAYPGGLSQQAYQGGNSYRISRATCTSNRSEDPQLKYHLFMPSDDSLPLLKKLSNAATSRNIIAYLHGKSVVGLSLRQALTELHAHLDTVMPSGRNNIAPVIDWLSSIDIHNVSYDPETACEILSWSESPKVRWLAGWREAFVHSVGMFQRVKLSSQYRHVSLRTKAMLDRAHFDVEQRMELAQEQLTGFYFNSLWQGRESSVSVSKSCFEKFRVLIVEHYRKATRQPSWPPNKSNESPYWLTRTMIRRLELDFGSLYKYLVDWDIAWDTQERCYKKGELASHSDAKDVSKAIDLTSRSGAKDVSNAPGIDLTVADGLKALNVRFSWPPIPHGYPHIPPSYKGPVSSGKEKKKFFSSKSQKEKTATDASVKYADQAATLSYKKASNVMKLGSITNDLLDKFIAYEESLNPQEIDPSEARRSHWFLIYGVMQVLATVSVDTPGLSYTKDVRYPLCCRMKGDGEVFEPFDNAWKDGMKDNSHTDSFCWYDPKRLQSDEEEQVLVPGRHYPHSHVLAGESWHSATDSGTDTGHSTALFSGTDGYARDSQQTSLTDPSMRTYQTGSHSSLQSGRNSRHSMMGSTSPNSPVKVSNGARDRSSYDSSQHRDGHGGQHPQVAPSKSFPVREVGASIPVGNTLFNKSFPPGNNMLRKKENISPYAGIELPAVGDGSRNLHSTWEDADDDLDDATVASEVKVPRPLYEPDSGNGNMEADNGETY